MSAGLLTCHRYGSSAKPKWSKATKMWQYCNKYGELFGSYWYKGDEISTMCSWPTGKQHRQLNESDTLLNNRLTQSYGNRPGTRADWQWAARQWSGGKVCVHRLLYGATLYRGFLWGKEALLELILGLMRTERWHACTVCEMGYEDVKWWARTIKKYSRINDSLKEDCTWYATPNKNRQSLRPAVPDQKDWGH